MIHVVVSFKNCLHEDLIVFSLSDKNTLDNDYTGHIVLSIYLSIWFIPFC